MERRVELRGFLLSLCIVEGLTVMSYTIIKIAVASWGMSDIFGEGVDSIVEQSLLSRIIVLGYLFSHFMLPIGALAGVVLSGVAMVVSDRSDNQRARILSLSGLVIGLLLLIAAIQYWDIIHWGGSWLDEQAT